jgi:nicotinamidase-related amidase
MIIVDGKAVYTELAELVDPAHTALLLVDMQRDFIDPSGLFGELESTSPCTTSRDPDCQVLAEARQSGALVIHIRNTALPDRMSDSPAQIRFNMRMHEIARADGLLCVTRCRARADTSSSTSSSRSTGNSS